jgi:hypothetical protein
VRSVFTLQALHSLLFRNTVIREIELSRLLILKNKYFITSKPFALSWPSYSSEVSFKKNY